MSFRLVIDGNAVYEIDEDCEKCGTGESAGAENQGRTMAAVTGVGKKTGENETNRRKQKGSPSWRTPRGCFCCLAAEAVAVVTAA